MGTSESGGLHEPPGECARMHCPPTCAPTCAPTAYALPRSASTSCTQCSSAKMADEVASLRRRYNRLPYLILLREPWGTERRSRQSGGREGAVRIPRRSGRVFRVGGADTAEGSRVSEPNSPPGPG
jgi:hypothetical protein